MSNKYEGFLEPVKKRSAPQANKEQKDLKFPLALHQKSKRDLVCGDGCGCESVCLEFASKSLVNNLSEEEGSSTFVRVPSQFTWDILKDLSTSLLPKHDSSFNPLLAVAVARRGFNQAHYQFITSEGSGIVHPIKDSCAYINAYVDRVMVGRTRIEGKSSSFILTGFYGKPENLNADLQRECRKFLVHTMLDDITK